MSNSPEMRIGDPERSRTIDLLSDRFANGYLNVHEFDERTGKAAQATLQSQLDSLLADLPPDTSPAARSPQVVSSLEAERELQEIQRRGKLANRISSLIWIGAIIVMFAGIAGYIQNWWIVFPIAALSTVVVRKFIGFNDDDEEIYEQLDVDRKEERQKRIQQAYDRKRELGQ